MDKTEVSWDLPEYVVSGDSTPKGVRFADVNADSLVDLLEDFKNGSTIAKKAYINTDNG